MRFLLAILFLMLPLSAQAQTIVLDQSLCKYMVEHRPAADVEYQDGVDVHGDPVVGADLNEPVIKPPKVIHFPITIDAAEYTGLNVPDGVETEFDVGTITLENKQLKFNGEPLTPENQRALIALCTDEDEAQDDTTGTETTQ